MHETFFIAFFFALLAFAGMQPADLRVAKVCTVAAFARQPGC